LFSASNFLTLKAPWDTQMDALFLLMKRSAGVCLERWPLFCSWCSRHPGEVGAISLSSGAASILLTLYFGVIPPQRVPYQFRTGSAQNGPATQNQTAAVSAQDKGAAVSRNPAAAGSDAGATTLSASVGVSQTSAHPIGAPPVEASSPGDSSSHQVEAPNAITPGTPLNAKPDDRPATAERSMVHQAQASAAMLACDTVAEVKSNQLVIAERPGRDEDAHVARQLCKTIGNWPSSRDATGSQVRTTIEIVDVQLAKAMPDFGSGIVWRSSASIRLRWPRGSEPTAMVERSFEGTGKGSAAEMPNGSSAILVAEQDALDDAVAHVSAFLGNP
jgi:hypothetical protein